MLDALLERTYFHNTVSTWTHAGGVLVGAAAAITLARRVLIHRLKDVAHKTPARWDDVVLDLAQRTWLGFELVVGVLAALPVVDLPTHVESRLRNTLMIITLMQCGWWATGLVRHSVNAAVERPGENGEGPNQTAKNMLRFAGMVLVWGAVALVILENLDIHIQSIIAGLGVTGVAVALATQNIVGDLFASISLLLDKPFLAGDFIVCEAYMGTVEKVGIRSTRLRSLGGEAIIMSNSDLTKSRVRNYRNMDIRRVLFTFGVPYDTPYEKLTQIPQWVQQAVEEPGTTRHDRTQLLYFGESSLTYEVVYYVLDRDYNLYTRIQQDINFGIIRRLSANKVPFATRTQVVYNVPWETAPFVPPLKSSGAASGAVGTPPTA